MYANNDTGSLELLFSSSARVKILTLFVLNKQRRFYQREIASLTGLPIMAVQRELLKMEKLGFVTKAREGNRLYYQVNEDFFLFPEIKKMILKTVGLSTLIEKNLKGKENIDVAFIFGSYAQDKETTSSDIDLFVMGKIKSRELHKIVKELQTTTGREINYILISKEEFQRKIKEKDHFITELLKSPKIFIKGSDIDLQEIAQGR
jgi:predicted nucleotidyltransferase